MGADEGDVRDALAEVAGRIEAEGLKVHLVTVDVGDRYWHGLEIDVPSVNDVVEFMIAGSVAPGVELEAFLGWQAAGEAIAAWTRGPTQQDHHDVHEVLREGSEKILALIEELAGSDACDKP